MSTVHVSVLDSRPPKSSVPNQLQVDQDKRVVLFDCIIENEYAPKVIKLSDRFSSLHITFILVYHSQWTNACVMSIWILYPYIQISMYAYAQIGKRLKKEQRKFSHFVFTSKLIPSLLYLMRSPIANSTKNNN